MNRKKCQFLPAFIGSKIGNGALAKHSRYTIFYWRAKLGIIFFEVFNQIQLRNINQLGKHSKVSYHLFSTLIKFSQELNV